MFSINCFFFFAEIKFNFALFDKLISVTDILS